MCMPRSMNGHSSPMTWKKTHQAAPAISESVARNWEASASLWAVWWKRRRCRKYHISQRGSFLKKTTTFTWRYSKVVRHQTTLSRSSVSLIIFSVSLRGNSISLIIMLAFSHHWQRCRSTWHGASRQNGPRIDSENGFRDSQFFLLAAAKDLSLKRCWVWCGHSFWNIAEEYSFRLHGQLGTDSLAVQGRRGLALREVRCFITADLHKQTLD